MKNLITTSCIVSALFMIQFLQAQTVDEIINKHIAAMGGKEKMMSLKTLKMTATAIGAQGGEFSYTFLKKHLIGVRIDFLGNKSWSIVTPKKGWSSVPGQVMPKEVLGDFLKFGQIQLDLQGPFLNYKEKGSKIELAGKEKINGLECYNLKITNKAGDIINYHVEMKTYRIIKKTFKTFFTIYADYKQNANGYWFAYTEFPSSGGKRTITKIETNITIDDKIFEVDDGVF
jgi:hypothetical protein